MSVTGADHRRIVSVESPARGARRLDRIGPGIVERTTCQLLVRYRMEMQPVFELAVNRWTGAAREIGYGLVGALEKLKYRLPMALEQPIHPERPGLVRRTVRRLRFSLAVRLLLPAYRSEEALPEVGGDSPGLAGFEASRRVFEFKTGEAEFGQLVCHVFAERHDEAADRLLNKFAVLVGRGVELRAGIYDDRSDLCLHARPSAQFRSRQYWEIIIGSRRRFPGEAALLEAAGAAAESSVQKGPLAGKAAVPSADGGPVTVQMPSTKFLQGVVERSKADWDFVVAEISRAIEHDEPLDEEFVRALAERRLRHVKERFPTERPGPTLESSVEIVRDIVALYDLQPLDE